MTDSPAPPTLHIWAPAARTVELLLDPDPDGSLTHSTPVAMQPTDAGWWHAPGPRDGQRYLVSVDGGPGYPDPRSPRQADGLHGPSMGFDPRFDWSEWAGMLARGAFTYELHVGTFTPGGTLDSAIDRLDYLAELGVQMVELMPVNPIPGTRGWGYDCVHLYAVWEQYGGPRALQRFVDAAHQRGLGVTLDVVYNHLGPTGNYLAQFGPYLRTDSTIWGQGFDFDGAHAATVRAYVIEAALRWFTDFGIDALRLDATHAIVDDSPQHVLAELAARTNELAAQLGRPLSLVAESDENNVALTLGRGLHAQWADDVHHAIHALLTAERQGYYVDFGEMDVLADTLTEVFRHTGDYSTFRERDWGAPVPPGTAREAFVVAASNHDQVGNRATGDRPSDSIDDADQAIAAALVMATGFTPLVFQGEEWAASTPFPFFSHHIDPDIAAATSEGRAREFSEHGWDGVVPDPQDRATFESAILDWDEHTRGHHARLRRWYRDLARLRQEHPTLRSGMVGDTECTHTDRWFTVLRPPFLLVFAFGPERLELGYGVEPILSWDEIHVADGVLEFGTKGVALLRLTDVQPG